MENLKAAVALFVFSFNFREVHRSIRCTPAMAAGVANTIWTWADLFANSPLKSDNYSPKEFNLEECHPHQTQTTRPKTATGVEIRAKTETRKSPDVAHALVRAAC
jgi:hypothetical protein